MSQSVEIKITGMHCAGCVASVENAIKKVDGVDEAVVNLTLEKATVTGNATVDDIISSITNAGYEGSQIESETPQDLTAQTDEKVDRAFSQMKLAWFFTIPAMIWMAIHMIWGIAFPSMIVMSWGLFVLSAVVCFYPGLDTLKSGWTSLIHWSPNMDVLIALGSLAALSTALLKLWIDIPSFAGIAGMIMSFHLTGRYIETKARGRSSEAIQKLMSLGAKHATVLDMDGNEVQLDVRSLVLGQTMIVRAGDAIPTDGEIIKGVATIDESIVTGESVPVTKRESDPVIGGTICTDSTLHIRVTKIGADTFLSKVIQLVESAQTTKVPIQVFADKVVGLFVPVVLGLASISFLMWIFFYESLLNLSTSLTIWLPLQLPNLSPMGMALYVAIAVLVIACPCALGLATPTALMVGTGLGAENGILIRDGAAIQTLNEIDVILFDKTGTLTKGKPQVTSVIPTGGILENDLIRMAASLEKESTHPLAKAILVLAEKNGIGLDQITDISVTPGKGIEGKYGSGTLKIGSTSFVNANTELKVNGTPVYLSLENDLIGIFDIQDAIRDNAKDTLKGLTALGYECGLVSGDKTDIATSLGQSLGIETIHAEVLPEEKASIVSQYQSMGKKVAMVGDGINDAPALAQSDVGIAMGHGTDIAMETGEIVLSNSDLNSVLKATKLSKATFGKIKQNLFWAFIYNIVAIPLAFLGVLHPVVAEIAMALSSINVVGNSNRLKSIKLTG